ncbi:hypothetical protein BT69DRAFT_1294539 [Atractiella rhizophila]|nr:hypothetical protein BT69DRAFT_1294539 [Atractiella rhizophila]
MDQEQGEGRSGMDDEGGEGEDRMQMTLLMELSELRTDNKEQRERGTSEEREGAWSGKREELRSFLVNVLAYHKEQKGREGGVFRSMVEKEDEVGEVREVERYSLMKAMEWLERLLQANDHILYALQQRRRDMRVQQGLMQYQELEALLDKYGSEGQELEKRVLLDPSNPECQQVLQHISYALQVKLRFVALLETQGFFPSTIRTHLIGLMMVRKVADTVAKLSEVSLGPDFREARKEKEERLKEKEERAKEKKEMFAIWKSSKMSFKPSTTQQPFTQNCPNPSFQHSLVMHRTIIELRLSSPLIPTRIEHRAWRNYLSNEGIAGSPLSLFPLLPGILPANTNECNICGMEWGAILMELQKLEVLHESRWLAESVEWEGDKEAEDEVMEGWEWEYMFITEELGKDLKVTDHEERRVSASCKLIRSAYHLTYLAPKARIDEVVGWSNILEKREIPVVTPIKNKISSFIKIDGLFLPPKKLVESLKRRGIEKFLVSVPSSGQVRSSFRMEFRQATTGGMVQALA